MAEDKERGARIKELMKERGYKAKDLAEKCAVSTSTVNAWVAGKTLNDHTLLKLKRHLSTSTDYILDGTKPPITGSLGFLVAKMPPDEREMILAYLRKVYIGK